MKKIIFIFVIALLSFVASAQDFDKAMGTAQTAYGAGKLEEAHFALMQALQEMDLIIGKEVLKLLPEKAESLSANIKDDAVTTIPGLIGTSMVRTYGTIGKTAEVSILSNSPMVAAMNTMLNMPIIGGMMSDGKSKIVRFQGYKGRLEKEESGDAGKTNYELQLPMGSALVTVRMQDCTETEITNLINAIPLQKVAKLIE